MLATNSQIALAKLAGEDIIQATNVNEISSKADQIKTDLCNAFYNMPVEDAKRLEILGVIILSLPIQCDQQFLFIINVLKNLTGNDEVKKLPSIYIDALLFVIEWLASPDLRVRGEAQKVFFSMVVLVQDVYKRNHSAEIVAQAGVLLTALDSVTTATPEQLKWIEALRTTLSELYQPVLSPHVAEQIVSSLGRFFCYPTAGCIQQEIFQCVQFIWNTLNTRVQEVQNAASQVVAKMWIVCNKLLGRK
jgi:hypothetical protein